MDKTEISNETKYDLEERTIQFAEHVIDLLKQIKKDWINYSIISQLVRSASSIGANYCEATEAESKKDFIHKISISRKESKETKHWLRLLAKSNPENKDRIIFLWKEANQLLLIFSKIVNSTKLNLNASKK